MPGDVYLEGTTEDGIHVKVTGEPTPYGSPNCKVFIDGEEVSVIPPTSRLRDGGTTRIPTERGTIVAHRRISEEPWDSFDGKRLQPEPINKPEQEFAAYHGLMQPFLERMVTEMVSNGYKGEGEMLKKAEIPALLADIFYHALKLAWVAAKTPGDKARLAEYTADVANCAFIVAADMEATGVPAEEAYLLPEVGSEEFQKIREGLEEWLAESFGWSIDDLFLGRSEPRDRG